MNSLGPGYIKNRWDGKLYPCEMTRLGISDLGGIMALQEEAASSMEDRSLYFSLSEREAGEILEGAGLMVGISVCGELVAFCASLFPGGREDNLGRDIGLPETELDRVVHLEAAVVHPAYRGNSLQKRTAGYLVDEIRKEKRGHFVMNTVSPLNTPSLRTTFSLGLMIKKLDVKYNGVLRYVFFMDIIKPVDIDACSSVRVSAADVQAQRALLDTGYFGFEMIETGDHKMILYGKEVPK